MSKPTKEQMLFMYRKMVEIRQFEEAAGTLYQSGQLPGFLHLYIGEEATAVGVCAHLNDDDYITSTHRGHGHLIAKGGKRDRMMAELFARTTGYCKGKGGSMHIADKETGILGANGVVGAGIPLAAGAALSAKIRGTAQIAVSFFGDGATNQGVFHETLNLAAVWELPVVFVCENNRFGMGTPQHEHQRVEDIAVRAPAYDIPGVTVDGNDVLKVYAEAHEAVIRAREGGGPTLLNCDTYRFRGHHIGDPGTSYRDREEVQEQERQRDPIRRLAQVLTEDEDVKQEELESLEAELANELEEALEFAQNSPEPLPEDALDDVYAGDIQP
ncbi:MAG: pyruvate dehydrogenase (acetyl-transferring) E1 component subunit alpha [Candidatus Poribacteria bacterium]|nr:pyruvate dehydrogenase (acetyl-transferring) E1 component subunit alpha [Candidatus Poribacteria bacterium]